MEPVGSTPSGSALSHHAGLAHARAHVLHLIEQSWASCGFGRTLVITADASVPRRLRERGLRAEHQPPDAALQAAERHRAAFDAVIVVDPPHDVGQDVLTAWFSMARRWVFVASAAGDGLSRAELRTVCANGGYVESPHGPLAAPVEQMTPAILCQPIGRVTPHDLADLLIWAATFVRPNDHVVLTMELPAPALDDLWSQTEASRIGQFDASGGDGVTWLRQSAADTPGRQFIDVIVVPDGDARGISEARLARLAPGGRVLCAAATSSAPCQHPALIYEGTTSSPRRPGVAFVSYMRTPIGAEGVRYVETVFPASRTLLPAIVDFAGSYRNPWLVHALVIGRFRLRNDEALCALARHVVDSFPRDAADVGGALCVLAYRALAGQAAFDQALRQRLDEYVAGDPATVHALRWQISLSFVAAKLDLADGRFNRAEAGFSHCARMDFMRFAPHLGTKTTEAAFLAGWLAWQRNDLEAAEAHWRVGVKAQDAIGHASLDELLVDPQCPAAFEAGDGLREVTIAADNALRCANGLRAVRHARTRGRARLDSIDRSLLQTSRELEGYVERSNLVAAERLDALHRRDRESAALLEERDRTQAGYVLLVQSLRAEVAALGDALKRETSLTRLLNRRASIERAPLSTRKRIVVFGTGRAGQFAAEALSRHHAIVAFLDNDPRRHGGRLFDRPVVAPAMLRGLDYDAVLVASVHAAEMAEQLAAHGVADERVYAMQDALSRIVVFGAGAAGQIVWDAMPRKEMIVRFADNAAAKQGSEFNGIPVIGPHDLPALDYRYVVVASLHREAIERQLHGLGVPPGRVIAIDPSRPPCFVAASAPVADLHDARAFHAGLEAPELERVRAFGQHAETAALLDFEPVTLAVGAALTAGGCRVTAFGAPAFVDQCQRSGLAATTAVFDAGRASGYALLVSGAAGWPAAVVGALDPKHRLIAPRRPDMAAHFDTSNLSFWYAPPREWLASPLEM